MGIEESFTYLVRAESLDSEGLDAFGLKAAHLCAESYLITATSNQIVNLYETGLIECFTPHSFPTSPFKHEYEYLGDFPVAKPVGIDLRLRRYDPSTRYTLDGELPAGLKFQEGYLSGAPLESSDICHFDITAQSPQGSFEHHYMIRIFKGERNRAQTFMQHEYLHVGCGPNLVDYQPDGVYYRHIPTALPAPIHPLDAARNAALWAGTQAQGREILLFSSGGIDSQCMIQAFASSGVGFKCIFMRDRSDVNSLDQHYFSAFARKHAIPHEIIELDFKSFMDAYRYVGMAHKYRFNNPEYGVLLHLMDLYPKAFPVYAGRPISVSFTDDGTSVLGLCGDESLSKARYLERTQRTGCPEFIVSTPELVSSFMNLQTFRNHPRHQTWTYRDKVNLLQEAGFDISLAPPIKGTGFETLEQNFKITEFGNDMWTKHRGPLKALYPNPKRRNSLPIHEGKLLPFENDILRDFHDGFGWKNVTFESIANLH